MINVSIDDGLLSEFEITYLDAILSDISKDRQVRSLLSYVKTWDDLSKIEPIDALESLRIKGIFNVENRKKTITLTDSESERFVDEEVEVGILQPENLIKSWITTIYKRSGKTLNLTDLSELMETKTFYSFPIKVGSDSITIKFVTKELDEMEFLHDQKESIYVSFIGELPIKEQYYIHWFDPLNELSAAARFFIWINEQSKPILSKHYLFVNIPSDLEKNSREEIFGLLKKYLELLNYKRINQPDNFKPESVEYFFPEASIRECYIHSLENKKLFITHSNDRVDIHCFTDGVKNIDSNLSFHLNKLQERIELRSSIFRKLSFKVKSSLISELLKFSPAIIAIVISTIASYKIVIMENEAIKNFSQSGLWLNIHIILSFITIFTIISVGLLPQIRYSLFSWDWRMNNFVKRNKKEYIKNMG
jgi:hypothetical protein